MSYTSNFVVKVDHTKCGASDSLSFPMLFSGTYAGGAGVPDLRVTGSGGVVTNASGFDIVFTSDAAGNSLLKWEIESYTGATGAVVFWVQIPTLSHSADTVIYLWAGNSAITTFQGGAVGAAWDANFVAVYHLPIGAANANKDSTVNANNITANTAVTAATGQIDGGGTFNGTTSFLSIPTSNSLKVTPNISCSAWVNPVAISGGHDIFGKGSLNYALGLGHTTGAIGYNNSVSWHNSTNVISLGVWSHVYVTHDGTNDLFYLNGALVSTVADTVAIPTSTGALEIGSLVGGFDLLHGIIDEVRISASIRSVDWILAEYNNQFSPATFYAITAANTFVPMCGAFGVGI